MKFERDAERANWISIVREGMFKYEPYRVQTKPITGGYGTRTVSALDQAIQNADAFIVAMREREKDQPHE